MSKQKKFDAREDKVKTWKKFYKLNNYYHSYIQKLVLHLIPKEASLIEFNSKCGELLSKLPNKQKLGVEFEKEFVSFTKKRKRGLKVIHPDSDLKKATKEKFDYILLPHTLNEIKDVQKFIRKLKELSHDKTRIIVFYFNYLWKPFLDLAEMLGLKLPEGKEPNWLSSRDIENFFYLENLEKVKSNGRFIFPYKIPIISKLLNKYVSALPIFNSMSLINYSVFRPVPVRKEYSVSIIIPARNEAGNMKGVLSKIPKFGKKQEVIFVEGRSSDDTYETIKNEIRNYQGPIDARLYKQKGKGKGDAARLGFSKAKNELLMILDADLTVDPKELSKFYNAARYGKADLIMGSRLVYPMEKLAMRTLNVLGNKFFSIAFTFLLDQRIKDTLCGTKVLSKSDYEKIVKNRRIFGDFDPFGDFYLIFGAAKLNLKILEIPIRYKERVYGVANISRFSHGFLLLKMCVFAARKLKFI